MRRPFAVHVSLASLAAVAAVAALVPACSDPVPPTPRGAWSVSFVDYPSAECSVKGHNASLGKVADTDRANSTLVTHGESGSEIACSVVGSSSFNIDASAYQAGSILQIIVNGISSSATPDNPAKGSVAYASQETVKTYSSNECDFYFIPNSGEGVGPGKVWVAFDCDSIKAEGSTCQLKQGYAIFENCDTGDSD